MPDTDTPSAEELAAALDAHNRWRRGDDEPAPDPTKLGKTIDAAAAALRSLASERDALRAALDAAQAPRDVPRLMTNAAIWGAFERSGLGRFHQKDGSVQYTYETCIEEFARAIESRVRELCEVAP